MGTSVVAGTSNGSVRAGALSVRQQDSSDYVDAAARADALVADQINAMMNAAQTRAQELREMAERDAKEIHGQAASEAVGLLETLDALERLLGQLMEGLQREVDHLHAEVARRGPTGAPTGDAEGGSAPTADAPVAQEPTQAAAGPEEAEPQEQPEPEETESERDQPVASSAEASNGEPPTGESQSRGLFRRRGRRNGRPFIEIADRCAVCRVSFAAGSEDRLRDSGWQVVGEKGLCPKCQAEGWELTESAPAAAPSH
jgi:vacuolar-type H+-ATPase subunit H